MAVEIRETSCPGAIEVHLSGKLTKQDYEHFVPELERRIEKHGKLRLLVEMHDFHGWTAGALWEDVKFDFLHFSDVDRLAMVGETRWQEGMAVFCKPFTTAKVEYFDHTRMDEAMDWLLQGLPAAREKGQGPMTLR